MKSSAHTSKHDSSGKADITLHLPGEKVTIGPGTVPSSHISTATIQEMKSSFREISDLGIFDDTHATK